MLYVCFICTTNQEIEKMPKRKQTNNNNTPVEKLNGKDNVVPKSKNDKDEDPWSKSKKKRMRRLMAIQNRNDSNQRNNNKHNERKEKTNTSEQSSDGEVHVLQIQSITKRPLSNLQQKFLSRLTGSRFRELNEELYTTTSSSAFQRFQENPELFEQYHEGFRTQVKSWPVNPVDVIYKWIISYYQKHKKEFQEKNQAQVRVADFGCGDAKLAEKLLNFQPISNNDKKRGDHGDTSKRPFKVHSFDLVANGNKLITPCDMSNVPLKNSSIDIGVFVLALMGTNIADFIREAHRVLTNNGVLKIAEVRSRFEGTVDDIEDDINQKSTGKGNMKKKQKLHNSSESNNHKQMDESVLDEFLEVMKELGFRCVQRDRQNKMFIIFEFEKTGTIPSKKATFTAKPCIYKRR